MQKIIEEIREYVHSQWTLGKIHGISHWDRVYENGQRLLAPGVNPLVTFMTLAVWMIGRTLIMVSGRQYGLIRCGIHI